MKSKKRTLEEFGFTQKQAKQALTQGNKEGKILAKKEAEKQEARLARQSFLQDWQEEEALNALEEVKRSLVCGLDYTDSFLFLSEYVKRNEAGFFTIEAVYALRDLERAIAKNEDAVIVEKKVAFAFDRVCLAIEYAPK